LTGVAVRRRFSGTVGTPDPTACRARVLPWWAWLALVSAVLVYATLPWFAWLAPTWPRVYAVVMHVRPWLNLGAENNFGAWWSGALLFLGSMLMFEVATGAPAGTRRAFAVLGLLSLGLSLDEVASVHERLSHRWGWRPLIAIGLACAGALAWALRTLARLGRRRTVLLVLAGYLCYGSIGLQEAAEHRRLGGWSWHSRRFEEGSEVLGSLLVLLAAVGERHPSRETRLRAVIPRPGRLPHLGILLTVGLVLHALAAVFVVPRLPDWHWRGNPALWYPALAHGLAASAAFWHAQAADGGRRVLWALTSAVFLVASIGAVFDEVALFPGIDRVLPRPAYYGFYAAYVFLVPPLLLLGLGGRLARRPALLLGAAGLPLILHWATGSWRVDIVTPGLLAWAFASCFRVAEPPEGPGDARAGFGLEGAPTLRTPAGPAAAEDRALGREA
jgi:hypothetical protein